MVYPPPAWPTNQPTMRNQTKQQITPLDLFVEAASALWTKHESELDALASKAEERIIRFGFSVIIDASGTVPRMTVRMAWTERVADEIETPMDVNQLKLFDKEKP